MGHPTIPVLKSSCNTCMVTDMYGFNFQRVKLLAVKSQVHEHEGTPPPSMQPMPVFIAGFRESYRQVYHILRL